LPKKDNMALKNINIIANAALGSGLSGGDRIFIELAKKQGNLRWQFISSKSKFESKNIMSLSL